MAKQAKINAVSSLEDHLGYWLRFVSNHVSQAFTQKVEAQGVTVAEWVVLRELFGRESANPSQVAEALGLTRGAVSKLVDRLVGKELVERTSVEGDRRYQRVALTEAGRKLTPILARLADENDREHFQHLNATERSTLLDLLQRTVRRHGWKDVPVQ